MMEHAFGIIMVVNILLLIVLFGTLTAELDRVMEKFYGTMVSTILLCCTAYYSMDIVTYFENFMHTHTTTETISGLGWTIYTGASMVSLILMVMIPITINIISQAHKKEQEFILIEEPKEEFLELISPEDANQYRLNNDYWLTGNKYSHTFYNKPISHMTDRHIKNVINLLEDNAIDLYGTNEEWIEKFKTEQRLRKLSKKLNL